MNITTPIQHLLLIHSLQHLAEKNALNCVQAPDERNLNEATVRSFITEHVTRRTS